LAGEAVASLAGVSVIGFEVDVLFFIGVVFLDVLQYGLHGDLLKFNSGLLAGEVLW
jgi:hypothetical protein